MKTLASKGPEMVMILFDEPSHVSGGKGMIEGKRKDRSSGDGVGE